MHCCRTSISVVRGKRDEIRLALCCLLTEGHLLLDDVPGTGKTSLAKAIANSISGTWKRVQFTPDLLPTDITGVMVFDQRTSTFTFREGPVFTNVLIGDEINRGSPKTQSALLEVMEERQVTADGVSRLGRSPVLRDRHSEPAGLPGDVSAARRPTRPVRDAAHAGVRRRRHRDLDPRRSTTATARRTTSRRSPIPRNSIGRSARSTSIERGPLDHRLHRADRERHANPPRPAPRRVDSWHAHDVATWPEPSPRPTSATT